MVLLGVGGSFSTARASRRVVQPCEDDYTSVDHRNPAAPTIRNIPIIPIVEGP